MKPRIGAMIFAAGLGSRFKPWTNRHPKALALVRGIPLLERNIRYLQRNHIFEVVVNIHHFPEQMREAIRQNEGWGSRIRISDETDALLETGGGLKKAAALLDFDHIVLINVDILTDLDLNVMLEYHLREQCLSTLAVTNRSTSRYFLFDPENRLCGWKNVQTGEERICRPAPEMRPMAFSGIHIVRRELPGMIKSPGKKGIVDVYLELAADHIIKAYDHSGGKLIDVGKPESMRDAERLFGDE